MPVEILMPELGESVHEATVTRWIVKEGDSVKEDDPVVEIMTDKVNTELPAPASGVLSKIIVPEGGTVHVFAPMGIIEEAGAATAAKPAKPAPKAEPEPAKQEATPPPPKITIQPVPVVEESRAVAGERTWFTPVVRSMAKQRGISETELAGLKGTGADGRVTKKDLEDYIAAGRTGGAAQPTAPAMAQERPAPSLETKPTPVVAGPEQEVQTLAPMRKMIADAMERASQVPVVTTVVQVDVTNLAKFRETNKEMFQTQYGVKLTYTPFFVHAAIEALKDHPILNASVEDKRIIVRKDLHIGIAVAIGSDKLMVPVIRNAGQKNVAGLAHAANDLATRARSKALTPDDITGGTFTVTNVGSLGSIMGTPIINQPQVAILATGAIKKRPMVIEDPVLGDVIGIRHMMYASLSYDHRIIDGAMAASFLQRYITVLESYGPDFEL